MNHDELIVGQRVQAHGQIGTITHIVNPNPDPKNIRVFWDNPLAVMPMWLVPTTLEPAPGSLNETIPFATVVELVHAAFKEGYESRISDLQVTAVMVMKLPPKVDGKTPTYSSDSTNFG